MVAWGDEEESGKDEGEDSKSCGIEDTEERDVGMGEVHGKYMGPTWMMGIQ